MLYQDRFDPNLKITFNGDEYTCDRRQVLKFNHLNCAWETIKFIEVKKGDKVRLKDPDGSLVRHEDGRDTYVALSNTYMDELGLLCFDI